MRSDQKNILREYVRTILSEINPQASFGSLKQVFIDPVSDAFNVSKGELKKIGNKTMGLVAKLGQFAAATLLPNFFDAKLEEINGYVKEQISSIESQNKDAWGRITPHARSAGAKLFFMADPAGFIAANMAKSTADEISDVVRPFILNAPSASIKKAVTNVTSKLKLGPDKVSKITRYFLNDLSETLLREGVVPDDVMQQIIISPEFKKIIASSSAASKMKSDVKRIGEAVAKEFNDIADSAASARTIEDLKRDFGFSFNDTDMKAYEKQGLDEQAIVDVIRNEIVKRLVSSIQGHITKVGFDKNADNPYYDALVGVLDHVSKNAGKRTTGSV